MPGQQRKGYLDDIKCPRYGSLLYIYSMEIAYNMTHTTYTYMDRNMLKMTSQIIDNGHDTNVPVVYKSSCQLFVPQSLLLMA
jgi:hypothetical protein